MVSKLILGALGAVVLVLLAIYTAFQVSPWPSALLIRRTMDAGGVKLVQTLKNTLQRTSVLTSTGSMTQATLTHFWMFFILLKSKKPIRRNMVLVATDPFAAMDPAANHGVPVNTHFSPKTMLLQLSTNTSSISIRMKGS
jgi:hypothetical protein